jgi:predicted nucleotidyltransferase
MRNNIRIMRYKPILDSLFPEVRKGILAATLMRPDKWWYLSELADFIRTRPSSLQRELSSLVEGGILERRRDGRRVYFKAETRSPIFADLRGVLERTAGLIPILQNLLRPFCNEISIAFIYGSVARKKEHATSDVDLMVVGSVGLAELSPGLRNAEKRLGREINVTSYSVHEFRRKIRRHDHFLTGLLKNDIQLVVGKKNDLEAIARPERRQASQNIDRRIGKRASDRSA